jgi:hypothetical protein
MQEGIGNNKGRQDLEKGTGIKRGRSCREGWKNRDKNMKILMK